MKKLIIALCVAVMGIGSLAAQKGQSAAGLNFGYGSEIESFSIGAKYQYGFTDAIRAEAAFNYFLEKNGVSMWGIDVTAHYLFNVAENIKVYPLAGVTYANAKVEWEGVSVDIPGYRTVGEEGGSASEGAFGINVGAGVEYSISENIAINLEAKYQKLFGDLDAFDQVAASVGVAYKF